MIAVNVRICLTVGIRGREGERCGKVLDNYSSYL